MSISRHPDEPRHHSPIAPLDALRSEWDDVRERRRVHDLEQGEPGTPPPNLTGLAFSGGGIRSATFNLGVLQALAQRHLLRHFDYLSTVSGGGFIGGWWSAWLARRQDPAPDHLFPDDEMVDVLRYVDPKTGRPAAGGDDPVHHVRLFSNYLTPRSGLFSPDVWLSSVVIARNLVLTWAVMLPALAIAVLAAQLALLSLPGSTELELFSPAALDAAAAWKRITFALVPAAAMLGWFTVLSIVWLLLHRGNSAAQNLATIGSLLALFLLAWSAFGLPYVPYVEEGATTGWGLIAWVLGAAIWVTLVVWHQRSGPRVRQYEQMRNSVTRYQGLLLTLAVASAVILLAAAFGHEVVKLAIGDGFVGGQGWQERITAWGARAIGVLSVIGGIRTWMLGAPKGGGEAAADPPSSSTGWLITIAPGLVLALLLCLMSYAVFWTAQFLRANDGMIGPVATLLQRATLIGSALAIVLAAAERPGAPRTSTTLALAAVALTFLSKWLDGLVPVMQSQGQLWQATLVWGVAKAPATVAGIGVIVALLQMRRGTVVRRSVLLMIAANAVTAIVALIIVFEIPTSEMTLLAGAIAVLATVTLALGWTADPNNLSLHMFYKSRLVRAYVGASNRHRSAPDQDVSLHVPGDNISMSKLAAGKDGAPYHLVNTTLNLAAASDVVMSQRRAANFIMSRLHCGSARTGYRPTTEYMGGELSLGTAIAVSGAAASPNMGSLTPSTALVMLMALLNVRLGFWAPTPGKADWRAPQARLWLAYLLREFFSSTTDQGLYCYLTDGGHFDNTGAYALVERGCRYIVMVDCGADPRTVFDDLSNLVRRCRIDFHAEINVDPLDPLRLETALDNRRHFVIGRISYARTHLRALGWSDEALSKDPSLATGYIVLVKPTRSAGIAVDIRRYGQTSSDFPQETTADQWYDEAQFESYRRLGEVSADSVFDWLFGKAPPDDHISAPIGERFGRPRVAAPRPPHVMSVIDDIEELGGIDTSPRRAED